MAIDSRRGKGVRDIRGLAKRVYLRWREYQRRHAGMSLPVETTLSRLFEHVPEYKPHRPRRTRRQNRSAKAPGVFKLQKIATSLETTVGDLLGEPGYEAARDLLSIAQRRTLRDAVRLLRDLFDLEDVSLDEGDSRPAAANESRFSVTPDDFIERDHDYPRVLHAWIVPETPAAAGPAGATAEQELASTQILHSIREVWDNRYMVIRVIGDSMAPELRHGWKILVDTEQTRPVEDALVAVYVKDEGGVIGRWHEVSDRIMLRKSNPEYSPVALGAPDEWWLWGTVTKVVEAPVEMSRR
jgi:hypothetical protein